MTAVTRPADARRSASRMMNSSIRCSFTGGLVGWITNTSWPRIESSILTLISPSGKWRSRGSVSGTSRISAILAASIMLAPPEINFSSPHGEAADVHLLADLGAGAQLGEWAAVGTVADPRVLYIHMRSDAALGANLRFAFEDRERLDHGVLTDGDGGVDERAVGVDDGDAAQHQALEQPAARDVCRPGEPDAVLDPHRLARVVELDDRHRLQVQEDVGQVELARIVVVLDLVELLDEPAAVEAVDADVELVHALPLFRGSVLALDDALEPAVAVSDHAAVVARRILDAGDGRGRARLLVGVDDLEDARCGQKRGVSVDHQHLAAAQLAGRNLLQRVRRTPRVALVDQTGTPMEACRHVGVVGVRDHRDALRA